MRSAIGIGICCAALGCAANNGSGTQMDMCPSGSYEVGPAQGTQCDVQVGNVCCDVAIPVWVASVNGYWQCYYDYPANTGARCYAFQFSYSAGSGATSWTAEMSRGSGTSPCAPPTSVSWQIGNDYDSMNIFEGSTEVVDLTTVTITQGNNEAPTKFTSTITDDCGCQHMLNCQYALGSIPAGG